MALRIKRRSTERADCGQIGSEHTAGATHHMAARAAARLVEARSAPGVTGKRTRGDMAERPNIRRGPPRHPIRERQREPGHLGPRNSIPHDAHERRVVRRVTQRRALQGRTSAAAAAGAVAPRALSVEDALTRRDFCGQRPAERARLPQSPFGGRKAAGKAQERREQTEVVRVTLGRRIRKGLGRDEG